MAATSRNSDINLLIRAKEEGVGAVQKALDSLFDSQGNLTTGATTLAAALASVDKAVSTVTAAADKGSAAFDRQQAALAKAKGDLESVKAQAGAAAEALATFNARANQIGPQQGGPAKLAAQIAAATAESNRLNNESQKLEKSIGTLSNALNNSRSTLLELGATERSAAEAQTRIREELEKTTASRAAATAAIERQKAAEAKGAQLQASLSPRPTATSSGATFSALDEQSSTNERQLDAAAKALKDELNPLAAAQARVNDQQRLANELYAKGKITLPELTKQTAKLAEDSNRLAKNGVVDKNTVGFLGLRPYELTNLGYQVNDVATQLASGTSLSQTLAQQGGQILQLFPKVSAAIFSAFANPYFLGAAAVIGAITLAITKAAEEAERLRDLKGLLALQSDGGLYDAAKINASAQALQGYGAKIGDATDALKTFVKEGIDPSKLDAFGRSAQNLAELTGAKLPDAAKQLADAFTGGYAAIVKLDDATGALTGTQRVQIRTLFEAGEADKARALAFSIFQKKLEDAAAIQRGPSADASRALGKAYDDLITSLSHNDAIQATIKLFGDLAGAISRATGNAAQFTSVGDRLARIAELQKQIAEAKTGVRATLAGAKIVQSVDTSAQEAELRQLLDQQKRDDAARAKPGTDPKSKDGNTAAAKASADAVEAIGLEGQLQALRDKGAEHLLSQAEQRRRIELAGIQAVKSEQDAAVGQAKKLTAEAHERADIAKQTRTVSQREDAEREKAYGDFEKKVIGAEGGAGKNPFSSAQGFGQFTNSTFLEQYRKLNPDDAAGKTDQQILALRGNLQIAKGVVDQYARENGKFLESFGAKITAGNLYLAHFLGAGGAKAVLTANPSESVDAIIRRNDPKHADGVLSGNQKYLRTENGKGRYRTASELQTFIGNRVGDTGAAQSTAVEEVDKLAANSKLRQDELNLSIKQGNDARQLGAEIAAREGPLQYQALIYAQRVAAIEQAVAEAKKQAEDKNKTLKPGEDPAVVTDQQIADITTYTAALFDLAHAKELAQAQTDEVQRPVTDLTSERDALRSQRDFLRDQGDRTGAKALSPALDDVNTKLRAAIGLAIKFQESLSPATDPLHRTQAQINATITSLKVAQKQSVEWGTVLGQDAHVIAQAFATTLSNGIDKFAQPVGEGQNVFHALKDAFLDFAGSFLRQIAQMIEQQIAFNIAKRILGAFNISTGGLSVPANHSGGVVGINRSETRTVAPQWFQSAIRYHSGGIAGLKPDEIPTILQRGEEVLTRGDTRHRANGGGRPATGNAPITIVNATNHVTALEQALRSPAGGRVILNHVTDNQRAFKAALG